MRRATMRSTGSGRMGAATMLAPLLVALGAAFPTPRAAAQELPAADAIIARYVEAIGGREANLAVSSLRMTGSFSMPGLGIQGSFQILRASPDRMSFSAAVPGLLEQSAGYDGSVAWTYSNLTGPMILEGATAAQSREDASALAVVRDRTLVPGRETVELTERWGEPCFRVRLVWASGRESFDCYSRESGLLIASEGTELSPMGDVPFTSLYSEYAEYSGIRLPTRIVQQTMGQEQVVSVSAVQMNAVDPSELAPPPSVRALAAPPGG